MGPSLLGRHVVIILDVAKRIYIWKEQKWMSPIWGFFSHTSADEGHFAIFFKGPLRLNVFQQSTTYFLRSEGPSLGFRHFQLVAFLSLSVRLM